MAIAVSAILIIGTIIILKSKPLSVRMKALYSVQYTKSPTSPNNRKKK